MSLKILGGSLCGRFLKSPPRGDPSIRPILARIKKSVFDIIAEKIYGSCFLDLYAGIGAVGIEALSRGASKVVFAELNDQRLKIIRQNVEDFGVGERSKIIKCDVIKKFELIKDKYDIVFLGPPYKDSDKEALSLTHQTLSNIVRFEILKENSLVISQKHIKETVASVSGLSLIRNEKYGDTIVSFYKPC